MEPRRIRQPENHAIIESSQSSKCARDSRDHFLAVLGVHLDRDGVAHGAGGHEEARLFAHDFGRALFQAIDRRVFAINVVAHFGFGHGSPHSGVGRVTVSLRRSIILI